MDMSSHTLRPFCAPAILMCTTSARSRSSCHRQPETGLSTQWSLPDWTTATRCYRAPTTGTWRAFSAFRMLPLGWSWDSQSVLGSRPRYVISTGCYSVWAVSVPADDPDPPGTAWDGAGVRKRIGCSLHAGPGPPFGRHTYTMDRPRTNGQFCSAMPPLLPVQLTCGITCRFRCVSLAMTGTASRPWRGTIPTVGLGQQ